MKKYFLFSIAALTLTLAQGQNCMEETKNKLQGVWFEGAVGKDSIGIIIKDNHSTFLFTYWEKEPEYWNMQITDSIPNVDTIADCKFFVLSKPIDNKIYFEILNLSDTSLTVKQSFNTVRSFKKIKSREPKSIREAIWGEWSDENTTIILKTDSTFSIKFQKKDYKYSANGKYRFDGEKIVLKDSQATSNNLPFDKDNEVHLYYNMLGLWLKETHMILVKMN